jgi:hypothetical protein
MLDRIDDTLTMSYLCVLPHSVRQRNWPAEIRWQVPIRSFTRLDHVSVPVALGNIVRRCEVVLICPHWLRASSIRCQ